MPLFYDRVDESEGRMRHSLCCHTRRMLDCCDAVYNSAIVHPSRIIDDLDQFSSVVRGRLQLGRIWERTSRESHHCYADGDPWHTRSSNPDSNF
jgi:hypothetical protein